MTISSWDEVIAGMLPVTEIIKGSSGTLTAGVPRSLYYIAGIPGAAAVSADGVAGASLTTLAGQIPFNNPAAGYNYLARSVFGVNATGQLVLYDRLWHNSGLSVTSTSAQTINSVAFPARDDNGATAGVGVSLFVEIAATMGAASPAISVSYTNSDGTAGRTATNIIPVVSASAKGDLYQIGLQAGDVGVSSIQSLTLSESWLSGTITLVAGRVISRFPINSATVPVEKDAVSGAFPKLHNNSVPFMYWQDGNVASTTAVSICGHIVYTNG